MKKLIGIGAVVAVLAGSAVAWTRSGDGVSLAELNAEIDARAHNHLQALIREHARVVAKPATGVRVASR
jgi:hypothetical protein